MQSKGLPGIHLWVSPPVHWPFPKDVPPFGSFFKTPEVSSRPGKGGFHRAPGEGNLRGRAGWTGRITIGGPAAGGFPSPGQGRLDIKSGILDFAGGDSEDGRGLHLGNRQGHPKNGKANLTGVGFKLRPLSHVPQFSPFLGIFLFCRHKRTFFLDRRKFSI